MSQILNRPLSVRSRLLALLMGTAYLYALTQALSFSSGQSFLVTAMWVVLGAIGIMGSIAIACMKLVSRGGEIRIRLLTLLFLFIPIAIYLSTIRWLLTNAVFKGTSPSGMEWLLFAVFVTIAIVATTIVLLWYAEAMLWLALSVAKHFGYVRDRRPDKDGIAARMDFLDALVLKRGHFIYESGHHGDLWLDLELLCVRPRRIDLWANELTSRLAHHDVQVVCGPLVEGAFIALKVAEQLDVDFTYAVRIDHPEKEGLFPVEYRIPDVLRERLRGKRVAIVNDVINAGSAVRGAAADVQACGGQLVALATLATIGNSAAQIAEQLDIPLYKLAALEARLWQPHGCPHCGKGDVLTK